MVLPKTYVFKGLIKTRAQFFDQFIEMGVLTDEWRREQHVIPLSSINRASHRVANQPLGKGRFFQRCIEFQRRIEAGFAGAVLDKLNANEQAAPADITHKVMIAEALAQALLQVSALVVQWLIAVLDKVFL